MEARFGVHWWRFSTATADVDEVLDSITGVSGGDFGPSESRGAFNQPRRFLHTSGASVYFGSSVESQPIVIEVPGQACEQLPADHLALWCGNLRDSRVTRVDLAADVEPASEATARLLEMRDTFRKGQCETRIPKTSTHFIESDSPGEGRTLYVGSTQSECMQRAYDKRGPLRCEWQWKPDHPVVRASIPEALQRSGVAALWRSVASRCVWPMQWYRDLLEGRCADIAHAPARPDDLAKTVDAIIEQLGPSLAMLQLLGVKMDHLCRMPEKPNAEQVRKWESWCEQAPALGYDPSKLKAKVKKWRRRSK